MSPRLSLSLAVLAALLLAGCNTPTTPVPAAPAKPAATAPATAPVTPPPAPVDVRPATIKGSEESSTLLDNFTAFVRSVDGQPVSAGRKGWNQALELKPGAHRLGVEFIRGSFFARAELVLEAKAGAAYELHQANDAQVYGQHSFCEFWITDLASGEKVITPKRVGLDKVKAGN
jgi:hypothetical protein